MLISKADIDEVKSRHDLTARIACFVSLTKRGAYLMGRCPFHSPDKTPSLVVDPQKQLWNCLGACRSNGNGGGGKGSSGGDLFAFEMKRTGKSFREVFQELGGAVYDAMPPPRKKSTAPAATENEAAAPAAADGLSLTSPKKRTELYARVVERLCLGLAEHKEAQEYLEVRGLRTRALWKAFNLGYSSGAIEELSGTQASEVRQLLIEMEILTKSGYERMKGRVVFPLVAFNQLTVSLYGRSIDDRHEPNHLFLPGPKRGLFNANAARRSKELLLVESHLCALSLIEAGIGNAIPLDGSNGLRAEHQELVTRFGVTSVVVGLDSDEAGRKAEPGVVDAFEALGLNVRVIEWPEKDPNALLVKHGPKKMREIVEGLLARPKPRELPAVEMVRVAANPPLLIASFPLEAVPCDSAVKEEKGEGAQEAEVPSMDHTELSGETLTLTSGDRLWRVVWAEGCSPSHLRATLRVRLGAKVEAPSFLDALDLVSARARESFARRAAAAAAVEIQDPLGDKESLQLQRAVEADLIRIAELGEERRHRIETKGAVAITMSQGERREALAFLGDPRLLDRIADDIEALGYVGEDTNKKLGYLVSISRKLDSALSMVILSTSGSGKSGLADALEALTPDEDLLSISRLTPQALYYMPKDSLRRKFVLIEERSGSQDADYSIRALQSKKKLTLAVPIKDPATGKIETKIFEILGPAAFLETTTESEINVENATRCFEIRLDETTEQTLRIQQAQRHARTAEGQRERTLRPGLVTLHGNAQRLLKTLPVVIPYAEAVEFPSAWIRTRRDNLRFLHLVEVLAFLHQYQRHLVDVKTGERVEMPLQDVITEEVETLAIEADLSDYAMAYALSREVLSDTFEDLSRPARDLYGVILSYVRELAREKGLDALNVVFTRRLIREKTRLPNYRIKALFKELEELEYVAVTKGMRGATSAYRLVEAGDAGDRRTAGLLSPEQLREKLS